MPYEIKQCYPAAVTFPPLPQSKLVLVLSDPGVGFSFPGARFLAGRDSRPFSVPEFQGME